MKHHSLLIREARRLGATDVRIEPGRHKHPQLRFVADGRPMLLVLRGHSPGPNGQVADFHWLYRLLGADKGRRKSARPGRIRRPRVEAEPVVPQLTVLPDPWVPLAGIVERVELDCRCRLPGIEGAEARVERAGVMACERIRAWVAAVVGGAR